MDAKAVGLQPRESYREWGRSQGRRPRTEILRYFNIVRFLVDADYCLHRYVDMARSDAYKDSFVGTYPLAEKRSDEALSLPIGSHVSDEQIEYVARALRESV
jgi:dTDP-4-amino-4,6-dideoxygalactose transaminase